MNYQVEDLSSIQHTDDLMSGFIDPDDITYGIIEDDRIPTSIGRVPTSFDPNVMPDLPPNMGTDTSSPSRFSMDDVDPELINAAISTTGTLIGMTKGRGSKKTEVERQLKATCGRRPLIGKRRKESYRVCANQALQTLMSMSSRGSGGFNNNNNNNWNNQPQGLSTGAVVGIVGGVVLVGALVVVLVTKK